MSEILYGKNVALNLKEDMKKNIENLKKKNIIPKVAIIRIGEKSDDIAYEKSIIKNCTNLGVNTETYKLEKSVSQNEMLNLIDKLNKDTEVNGILVFRPFPKHLDQELINSSISAKKDIDCMNPLNLEKIFEGKLDGFMPCTAEAVVEMLKYYNINLEGSNVVIINRSMVVGKPLSMMLLSHNATVTICHSKTKKLSSITKNADIVVTAVGKAKMIDEEYFSKDSVVIDVSINVDDNGKLCGDIDYDSVYGKVKAITPVPRGVGSVTTTLLIKNIVDGCIKQNI
ncbi:bifunctional 5,10-methylenetetrahydrofolate dehydrogenase/5,10-methenyltetrahydrofolate cyclohydrolase [Clostridium oceanicum]|uniref:Bifunctional protein FolD n=1 Tax=Clostridium oceanicum TaxID=1543 RepID=A0ABP3ULB2_9CLOT